MRALRSRKTLYVAVPLILVFVVASVVYFSSAGGASAQGGDQQLRTSTARRGDLSLLASGTGTLIPAAEMDLGFDTSGELVEILVDVGDEVEAGQVLARLDSSSAKTTLAEAEATLRERTSPLAVAQAKLAVADAKEALESAQYTFAVNQEGHRATQDAIEGAKARLAVAKDKLEEAQSVFDRADGDAKKAMAYDQYASAKKSYTSALATYNWYTGHPTEIEQSQLESDVAIAEGQLLEAQSLGAALAGEELPEGAFGDGLTALENARANVDEAHRALEATELRAPVAGTITAVDAVVGETVGESSVMTLMDISLPHVEFYLDQTDIDKAAAGEAVEVTFDAYPDVVYTGTVTAIDPVLTTSGGVSAVHGFAALAPLEGEDSPRLLVGLSAAVDVIAGRVEDAILVPVEALREITPGTYAVFVVDSSGELEMRMVEVGLQDETFAAIASGLEAGEVVSTGIVEVNS